MTDPWLVQSVETISVQVSNERPITLKNGKQEDKELEEEEEVNRNENKQNLKFEDNFAPNSNNSNNINNNNGESSPHQPLADSAAYLEGLEIKLKKLRKGSKLLDSLSAKREDCMRTLLDDNATTNHVQHDELNEAISNGDSAVQEIYRHLQPIQAVTVGELVHILKHDQLTDNNEEDEEPITTALDTIKEHI